MSDVFISYSRKDTSFARKLFDALKQMNLESWVDWEGIPYSADWWQEICRGIDSADVVVFIISPDSLSSKVCNAEIAYARENNKRILPVIHRPVDSEGKLLPEIVSTWFGQEYESSARENWTYLCSLNWLFFREGDPFEAAFLKLVESAQQDPDYLRAHTRLLVRAKEWENRPQRENGLLLRGEDLVQAENWLLFNTDKVPIPTPLHRTYIQASIEQRTLEEKRERRTQRTLVGLVVILSVLLLLAIISGLFAISREQVAQTAVSTGEANLRQAWQTQSLFLADLGRQQLNAGQIEAALELGLESLSHYSDGIYNPQAHQLLIDSLIEHEQIVARFEHNAPVTQAEWGADENYVVSTSSDNLLTVWNATGGDPVYSIQFENEINWVYRNSQNDYIAVKHNNNTVDVYHIASNRNLYSITFPEGIAAISWEDKTLIVVSNAGHVLIWNDENPQTVRQSDQRTLQFQPLLIGAHLGRHLFADDDQNIWMLDFEKAVEGSIEWTLVAQHNSKIIECTWNPAGTHIVITTEDGVLHIWDVNAESPVLQAESQNIHVHHARWNNDGTRLLAFSSSNTEHENGILNPESRGTIYVLNSEDATVLQQISITSATEGISNSYWLDDPTHLIAWQGSGASVWNAETGETLFSLDAGEEIKWIDYMPFYNILASYTFANQNQQGIVRLWDAESGDLLNEYTHNGDVGVWLGWNPSLTQIVSNGGTTVQVQHFDSVKRTFQPIAVLSHSAEVEGFRFSDDPNHLLTWDENGQVRIWNLASNWQPLMAKLPATVSNLSWNTAGTQFVASDFEGNTFIIDGRTASPVFSIKHADASDIIKSAWRGDGNQIITWGWGQNAKVWDAKSGELVFTLIHSNDPEFNAFINGAAWSPDQTRILTWSVNDWVTLWDATTGKQLYSVQGTPSEIGVTHAVWSPNSSRFMSWEKGSVSGAVDVWDAEGGKRLFSLQCPPTNGPGAVHDWSPDGTRIATACGEGTVHLWDSKDGQLNTTLVSEVSGSLYRTDWNPDGKHLVATTPSSITVWDMKNSTRLWTFDTFSGFLAGAQWSATGDRLFVWTGNNSFMIYMIDTITGNVLLQVPYQGNPLFVALDDEGNELVVRGDDDENNLLRIWHVGIEDVIQQASRVDIDKFTNEERRGFFLSTLTSEVMDMP